MLACSGAVDLLTAKRAFEFVFSAVPATPQIAAPHRRRPKLRQRHLTEARSPGGGATAICNDGTYSYAAHHQGACSSHGGVAQFYK